MYNVRCSHDVLTMFSPGQNGETAQYSPAIQHTLEVYLNGVDSQHSSDSEFY